MPKGVWKRTQEHKFSNRLGQLKSGRKGEKIKNHILTEFNVLSIRALKSAGWTERAIASEMGFAKTTVGDVIRRRTWTHVK